MRSPQRLQSSSMSLGERYGSSSLRRILLGERSPIAVWLLLFSTIWTPIGTRSIPAQFTAGHRMGPTNSASTLIFRELTAPESVQLSAALDLCCNSQSFVRDIRATIGKTESS